MQTKERSANKLCPIGRDVSCTASNLHHAVAKSNKVTERSLEPMWLSTCHPTGASTAAQLAHPLPLNWRINCRPTGASIVATWSHPEAKNLPLCHAVASRSTSEGQDRSCDHFWFRQNLSHNRFGSTNKTCVSLGTVAFTLLLRKLCIKSPKTLAKGSINQGNTSSNQRKHNGRRNHPIQEDHSSRIQTR